MQVRADLRIVFESALDGCYEADRTAALSGVPESTVYDWARKGVVVPSVSEVKPMRWSYADLMGLRVVYWLRHPKDDAHAEYAASPMPEVRRALKWLESVDLDLWSASDGARTPLLVDRKGHITVRTPVGDERTTGQAVMDILDLLAPFETGTIRGPDLVQPRPHLRIVPGKVAGEPHLQGSRLTTVTVAALAARGFDADAIALLYPDENPEAIREAIDLERALAANLKAAA